MCLFSPVFRRHSPRLFSLRLYAFRLAFDRSALNGLNSMLFVGVLLRCSICSIRVLSCEQTLVGLPVLYSIKLVDILFF